MAGLPDQLLQWLYSVLLNEYHDAQRAYSDSVAALTAYPSLSPRTDVYTYNTGQPALLLRLSGTLPVNFRGTVYRFPVTIWLPHAYPTDREGIMVFVIPGDGMAIRPGQHVSVDGRVYHPYLRDWSVNQRPNIVDFLRLLQDVFAREPPVVAKPAEQPQSAHPQSPMQRPPPPPKEQARPTQPYPAEMPAETPPPRPPKPGEQGPAATPFQSRNDGPPLPPLPHERARQYTQPQPLPPPQQNQQHQMPLRSARQQYPQHYQQQPQQHFQQMPPHMSAQQYPPQHTSHQQPMPAKPAPAQDLLGDPFDVSISTTTASGPAPPIPPNPEKEHLLHLLSQSLVSQIHQKVNQNTSALAPLRAQSIALQEAHSRLSNELSQLTVLDNTLTTNERILHQALSDCDRVIADSKSTPQPPIDDVLVAPTVASTQLWNLQADEAAIREALWCLQRAVGAGRVGSEVFIKMTRSLARELFLKMALSKKVARGLGLDVGGSRAGTFEGDDAYGY
ncbi:UEV-domain-containing protein [Aureobasidium namibiae CBS 147.97]|uniref:UEV-domain-containing protein n=1 Tax=Aureobasidium namibiae CBS 147.97 TaxID=1043004 RepID=A0A074X2T5_9PEZI|nr:UEV-domain-containing protein [Aureobasidium namibiae CBS 147.97]KEQ68951.1 UEV-domain-containing protein [Aureobasidium namibiae CBS 147.97]